MAAALSFLKLGRMRPPLRRVLAVDAGSRCIKLLLAESDFGRLRIVKEESLDLQSEGLVSAEEIKSHLQARLDDWANPPLALVLPQHLSISQVMDLPLVPESEVEKLIAEETVKLGGVSESRIVYDFVRTETSAKNRQQFWVTLCREGDIRERIAQLGVEQEDLCEITTVANALATAYRVTAPLSSRAVLVHLGAQTTVLVVLLAGQGAFATSFQMGGDSFTRALARARGCAEEAAESLKRSADLLNGTQAVAELAAAIEGWVGELKRQLTEWFQHNKAVAPSIKDFELVASGGGFEQPGLLEYLKTAVGLNLAPWPKPAQAETVAPARGFEVAFGTALLALGYSAQPVSLLPADYRLAWRRRLGRQRLEFATLVLLLVCAVILGLGSWKQISLYDRKLALQAKVDAAQNDVQANEEMTAELTSEYSNLRPVFLRQQTTLDILNALALLQESRSKGNFWYVLVADQQTYFSPTPVFTSTNPPVRTNLVASLVERSRAMLSQLTALTNVSAAKPGLIAELCIPGEAEAARGVLGQLVKQLKPQGLFAKVDLLSDDLRRSLAEPKVIIPDRHFVLALDFAATQFQQPLPWQRPAGARSTRIAPKRLVRPVPSAPDSDPGQPPS